MLSVNLDELKYEYTKHGIQWCNVEIIDMNPQDFIRRSRKALRILNKLVNLYGKVYVHCTAGIYRSPQLVALYLV